MGIYEHLYSELKLRLTPPFKYRCSYMLYAEKFIKEVRTMKIVAVILLPVYLGGKALAWLLGLDKNNEMPTIAEWLEA